MTSIRIKDFCKNAHVSRPDGARVRNAIVERWNADGSLELDFDGVRVASVSFSDESIGLLALVHPPEELTARIRVTNISPPDRRLLNQVVARRVRERSEAELAQAERVGP